MFIHAGLLRTINLSSTPNPIVQLVDGVPDYKHHIQPHLSVLEGHSKYAVFRFTRDQNDHAEMHYKISSKHPWEPEKEPGISLFSVSFGLLLMST